ncbi:hypothetical protein BDR03DRAFT_477429 [Suillus americanus]|nr:hypothetical protein BDR03DRAFT_477429 [Suillus americanus]
MYVGLAFILVTRSARLPKTICTQHKSEKTRLAEYALTPIRFQYYGLPTRMSLVIELTNDKLLRYPGTGGVSRNGQITFGLHYQASPSYSHTARRSASRCITVTVIQNVSISSPALTRLLKCVAVPAQFRSYRHKILTAPNGCTQDLTFSSAHGRYLTHTSNINKMHKSIPDTFTLFLGYPPEISYGFPD